MKAESLNLMWISYGLIALWAVWEVLHAPAMRLIGATEASEPAVVVQVPGQVPPVATGRLPQLVGAKSSIGACLTRPGSPGCEPLSLRMPQAIPARYADADAVVLSAAQFCVPVPRGLERTERAAPKSARMVYGPRA